MPSINIPKTVRRIGQKAFADCSALKTAEFNGDQEPICDETVFESSTESFYVSVRDSYQGDTFCGSKTVPDNNSSSSEQIPDDESSKDDESSQMDSSSTNEDSQNTEPSHKDKTKTNLYIGIGVGVGSALAVVVVVVIVMIVKKRQSTSGYEALGEGTVQ